MHRPDHTNYVAHFTKGKDPVANLVSMFSTQTIRAGKLPWTNNPAVCFTECPWASLLDHAARYSPYGIGFDKDHVFAAGGGPAYYVRADHWSKQNWDHDVKTFVTPFWPAYRPAKLKGAELLGGKTIDFSHEREWRVPHDFKFDPRRVAFVILDTYGDMAKFPKELKNQIGREKFIPMDMCRKTAELWPTLVLNRE